MEEKLNQDNITPPKNLMKMEKSKERPQRSFRKYKAVFIGISDIRTNTDQAAPRSNHRGIPFKGHTSWILICFHIYCIQVA